MIEDRWYKNAVIYSLEVETFLDANGDGIGDFEGLIRRLEYLEYLGVDAIWLAPFHPSPNRDNGYDVSDYYGVHPRYGSSGDFVELVQQAKKHGLRVLMDLVVNHTSDEHPWFKEARAGRDVASPLVVRVVEEAPEALEQGHGLSGCASAHVDLRPQVARVLLSSLLRLPARPEFDEPRGAARDLSDHGFLARARCLRVSCGCGAVHHRGSARRQNEASAALRLPDELRQFVQWRKGDAVLLGEANVLPDDTLPFFGEDGDRIHMMFNFFVNQHLFYALATHDIGPLVEALKATLDIPPTAQWAHFLRNHDELDLGRLTDEQRERVFARFAPDEHMQLYGRGIRRRLAPMLGDRKHEELAYSILFSLPGSPVIRFGDELRMGDDLDLEQREAVRTPMQWANEPHGGFTTAEKPVIPVIDHGVWSYEHVNVEAQRRDPSSFLSWMAQMIRLRKECPEIGLGQCTVSTSALRTYSGCVRLAGQPRRHPAQLRRAPP